MKIALITKNWNFLPPIKKQLEKETTHHIKQFWPVENEHVNWTNIMSLLQWCDIAFFDFAQTPLVELSNLAVKPCPKIVVRVLGLEVFYNVQHINWQHVDHIICISEHQKQRLIDLYLPDMPPITVIPLGVNVEQFTPPENKEFGYNICQVGNMLPHKRHYELIQLFADLIENTTPYHAWHLHIHHTTDGTWRAHQQKEYTIFCKELIEELELVDKVTIHDFDAQWQQGGGKEFFSNMDIIVSNSMMEGYHKTPMEGMACGVHPIVNCWRGAKDIYPSQYVFETFSEALDQFKWWENLSESGKQELADTHRNYAVQYHDERKSALVITYLLELVERESTAIFIHNELRKLQPLLENLVTPPEVEV